MSMAKKLLATLTTGFITMLVEKLTFTQVMWNYIDAILSLDHAWRYIVQPSCGRVLALVILG